MQLSVHRRRVRRRRGIATAGLAAGLWALALVVPAAAEVTGPCDGQVTIDGVTYTPANDTAADPIVVPADAETAEWEGRTDVAITDHEGSLGVVIGPGTVEIADWGGENADLETSADGTYTIAEARDQLPVDLVGLYELSGSHTGEGGTCTGTVMVEVEGTPLTTPIGAGAAAATVLSLAGLAIAGAGAATGGVGAGGSAAGGSATTTEVR